MTIELSAHLSEEAMNDVLIGLGSPEAEAHLAACPACRKQLEGFNGDMQLYNQASLRWSEARSATMPAPVVMAKRPMGRFAPIGMALAAAILISVGVLAWHHNHGTLENSAVAPAAQQDDEAQIAADNELMRSVDVALSAGEESPLGEFRMAETPHPRVTTGPRHGPAVKSELRNR